MRHDSVIGGLVLLSILSGCAPHGKGENKQASPASTSAAPLTISLDNSFPERNSAGAALREHYDFVAHDVL